jgi:hypothetical protein
VRQPLSQCGAGSVRPGLPDGLFSNQKSQFGKNSQGLRLENIDIFYGHLEYSMPIWKILWPFGIFYYHLAQFVFIWYIFSVLVSCNEKNLATLSATARKRTKAATEK